MNHRTVRARLIALLIAAALWPGLSAGARAEADAPVPLAVGALALADLDAGEASFAFTAPSGSVYDVWLFPAGEGRAEARAGLWRDGELLAEGGSGMPAISLRLTSGAEYGLKLRGSGQVRLEIARHALSRCFDMPMLLDAGGDVYSKVFAREGDAHWYAVDAEAADPVALVGVPLDGGLRLAAELFDDEGRMLSEALSTDGGACLMDFVPEAGRRYRIRLSAENGATGMYELRLTSLADGDMARDVSLSAHALALEGRSSARLEAALSPEGANGTLYWESSDPGVARADASGRVTGVSPGEAIVTAWAAGGASDRCGVTVSYVPVSDVRLFSRQLTLCAGDDASIELEVLPDNASDPRLSYEAEPSGIVEIDRRGVVRGIREGAATVTVRSLDGGLSDALTVTVTPSPRRLRALLVGEQNYASTVAAVRTGSVNSVTALRSMLEGLSFDGTRYQVTARLDVSRDGVLAAIDEALAEATDGDMSLFYITCHGYYAGGMTCLQMYDGSVLTAAELAAALRKLKGEVLVVIDCCGSGGAIGRASATSDILRGIDAVFSGIVGPPVLAASRFRVLASAALEQDSYRLSFSEDVVESGMATVFARALCEAGGWSIDRAARAAMRADADYDGAVTLNELYIFLSRRVMWYLDLAASPDGRAQYAQSVQVWPEADGTVVFER